MQAPKVLLLALFGLAFNFCTVQCYGCRYISQDTGTIETRLEVQRDSWVERCWELPLGEDDALQVKVSQFDIISEDTCQTTDYYYRTTPPYWYRTTPPYWYRTTPPYWYRTTPPYWYRTTPPWNYRTTSAWDDRTRRPDYDHRRVKLTIRDNLNNVSYTYHPTQFNRNLLILKGDTTVTLQADNQYNWCIAHKIFLRLEFARGSGIETIKGIYEAKHKLVTWMKNQLSPPLKWHDDIEKMVIALHLSDGMNFSKTGLREELLIKQVDLKSSVTLLRNTPETVSLTELAKMINSLLVTCHNPRSFYGYDLIKMAKEKLEEPLSQPNPLAYIALCNANETLSYKALRKLLNIVGEHRNIRDYPFSLDISALGFMAVSCLRNQLDGMKEFTEEYYNNTLEHLKAEQEEDGSFGNIYSTALFTQALMSSNAENQSLFNDSVSPAVKFLLNHLNTSDFGMMAAYYTLPILNGKTLLDIRHTDCSRTGRDGKDISDIEDKLGKKIKVKYSLILGDKEDITNTLSLRVPDNITAYDVMRLAQTIEPKYKFEWKRVSGKMYVYEMANTPVDPEEGRYWLTYFKNNTSTTLNLIMDGPDKLQLHNGYHLIQWYKSVHF